VLRHPGHHKVIGDALLLHGGAVSSGRRQQKSRVVWLILGSHGGTCRADKIRRADRQWIPVVPVVPVGFAPNPYLIKVLLSYLWLVGAKSMKLPRGESISGHQ